MVNADKYLHSPEILSMYAELRLKPKFGQDHRIEIWPKLFLVCKLFYK